MPLSAPHEPKRHFFDTAIIAGIPDIGKVEHIFERFIWMGCGAKEPVRVAAVANNESIHLIFKLGGSRSDNRQQRNLFGQIPFDEVCQFGIIRDRTVKDYLSSKGHCEEARTKRKRPQFMQPRGFLIRPSLLSPDFNVPRGSEPAPCVRGRP